MRANGGRPHFLLAMVGILVVLAASVASFPRAPQTQTGAIHSVADQADNHSDDDASAPPEKAEPTHSGLRRGGLLDGLANTMTGALSVSRQIVQSDEQTVGPGQSSEVEVTCPAPFQVVNGGESNTGTNVRLTKNYPVTTPMSSGWHVQVTNDDSVARSYRVYADCISGLTQYVRLERLNQDVSPGNTGQDKLQCASGSTILGGGYSVDATDRFAVSASYAESGAARDWLLQWRNVGSSPAHISLYAICAAGVQQGTTKKAYSSDPDYARASITCAAPSDQALGAGWAEGSGNSDSYIVVTDSYPTSNGYVVWGHQYNGAVLSAIGYCGTVS